MFSHSLRRIFGTALTSVALVTAACGGDGGSIAPGPDPTPAPADLSGTYGMTSLKSLGHLHGGGNALPVTFTDGGGSTLTFSSGQLVLTADGSYTLEVGATFNGNGVNMSDEGNYSVVGASISFVPSGSPKRMQEGTISGTKITARAQFGGIPFEVTLKK